ncbi:MAG: hypothetical protein ACOX8W_05800 [bacterium]|jgi:hypothetical protein
MPGLARIRDESGIYNALLRGSNRQRIFGDKEDCRIYLQCVAEGKAISVICLSALSRGKSYQFPAQSGKRTPAAIFPGFALYWVKNGNTLFVLLCQYRYSG